MTNEEAQQLVMRAEKSLYLEYSTSTRITFLLSVCAVPLVFVHGFGILAGSFSAFLGLACWMITRDVKQEMKSNHARATWTRLMTYDVFGESLPLKTAKLRDDISAFYQEDVNSKVFPMVQAVRLLDAHQLQQKPLDALSCRLNELQLLAQTMREKLGQLRQLGEDAPEVERKLAQLERDEAALQNIHNQISASCARLEAIFTSVQHAHQVRQLKRELGELSQSVSGPSSELALENDAFDIERQIAREIETFLRLERETDEHLRDV